jgi:hypothetical protein
VGARAEQAKKGKVLSPSQAMVAASWFILFHYPTMFTGARPHRLRLATVDLWVVPVVLTHPDHGIIGEVGMVGIESRTGEVVGHTPRAEGVAAAKRLRACGRLRTPAGGE